MAVVLPDARAIYGLTRLVSGYAGNCLRLRRESDNAETDIGFGVDGWVDSAAATAHIGASTGRVVTWYDQSGNGYNATNATVADQPLWRMEADGRPAVYLHSTGGPAVFYDLDISTSLVSENRNVSLYQVCRSHDTTDTSAAASCRPAYQIGTVTASDYYGYSAASNLNNASGTRFGRVSAAVGGAFKTTSHTAGVSNSFRGPNAHYFVAVDRSTTTGFQYRYGDWLAESFTAGTSKTGLAGGNIGKGNNGNFRSTHAMRAWCLCLAHDDTEENAAVADLSAEYAIPENPANQLIVVGSSISAGHNTTNGFTDDRYSDYAWPGVLWRDHLDTDWLVLNCSRSGGHLNATAQGGTASVALGQQLGDLVTASIRPAITRKIVVIALGSNDLSRFDAVGSEAGAGATVHTRLTSAVTTLRNGWNAPDEIYVCTILPRSDFSVDIEPERLACNTLIRGDAAGADGVIDLDAAADWTDAAYATYFQDGIHPNPTGQAIIAAEVNSVLNVPPLVAPTLTVTSTTAITLEWTAATGGVEPYTYDVYRDAVLLASNQSSPYVDSTATPGVTYTYFVRVTDAADSTADSNSDTGTGAVVVTDIDVAWQLPASRLQWVLP